MKINIAVMEDEQIYRDIMNDYLRRWGCETNNILEISSFSGSEAFLTEWESNKNFDVVFFDIVMLNSELNGMNVAAMIRKQNDDSFIIFTTSVTDYMQEGYHVEAFRYLIKPLDYEDIKECMDKVFVRLSSKHNTTLTIKYKNEIQRIPYRDILYFSSIRHYVETHTGAKIYKHMQKFQSLLSMLPPEFCRCHRTIIVNIEAIYSISKLEIILVNHQKLPVSESYLNALKEQYMLYFG